MDDSNSFNCLSPISKSGTRSISGSGEWKRAMKDNRIVSGNVYDRLGSSWWRSLRFAFFRTWWTCPFWRAVWLTRWTCCSFGQLSLNISLQNESRVHNPGTRRGRRRADAACGPRWIYEEVLKVRHANCEIRMSQSCKVRIEIMDLGI